ncbi:MAG: hypothetical protein ACT4PL_06175 [Phycisphaerales bacterium]
MLRTPTIARAVVTAAALWTCAGLALAQNDPAKEPETRQSVLVLERVSLDKILVAPKDQALRRALGMLPARLLEIPSEVPDGEGVPTEAIELITRLASSPVRLGVTYDAQNQKGGFGGAGIVLSFAQASEAEAKATSEALQKALADAPEMPALTASKQMPGMVGAVTPAGVVRLGPRKTAAGWAFEVHAGTVPDPEANLKELAGVATAGVTPFIRGRFDPAPLSPLLGLLQVVAGANPQAGAVVAGLTERNLIGEQAAKWSFAIGHSDDATVSRMTLTHVADGDPIDAKGARPLTEADFRLIPADAYFGNIAALPKGSFDSIQAAVEENPEAAAVFDTISDQIGVDLLAEVLPSIGDSVVTYISDSTGGGSLASQVVIISLADRAKLVNANGKLVNFINAELAKEETARGYVSVRSWKDEATAGAEFFSVSFAGIPFPIEPTYAFTERHLIIGFSPQAAVAAVRQATGKGDAGIGSVAAIAANLPKGKTLNSFAFTDTSRVLRAGYPFVSAFGSMVGNAVRSRANAEGAKREPGMIVPTYAELASGARPLVSYSYWDGKSMISEWRGDKSLLVNMGAVVGQYSTYWPVIAAAAAAAGFATQQQGGGMFPPPDMDFDDGDMDEPAMRIVEPAGR